MLSRLDKICQEWLTFAHEGTKFLSNSGPRLPMIGGPLLVAAGLGYLSLVTADGNYYTQVLPALVLMGCGMGFVFVPLQNLAGTRPLELLSAGHSAVFLAAAVAMVAGSIVAAVCIPNPSAQEMCVDEAPVMVQTH